MANLLIKLLYRKAAVPKNNLISIIESLDADQDGLITMAEVASVMKAYTAALKKAAKYHR